MMKPRAGLNVAIVSCFLLSCEHQITQETRVGEDGALSKTIVLDLDKKDSAALDHNYFGVAAQRGWETGVESFMAEGDEERYRVRFQKEFAAAEDMNTDMDTGVDSLFQIKATFQKQVRWLFTYIRYEETYRALNRFRFSPAETFFTEEDFEFIRRLPPQGTPLSLADSTQLKALNKKITEEYLSEAMFKEVMDVMRQLMTKTGVEARWMDTLTRHEPLLYDRLMNSEKDEYAILAFADSLKMPLPANAKVIYDSLVNTVVKPRLDFMSYAWDSRFSVIFEMPWGVTDTNADSTAGNRVYWRPLPHKFGFNDYTFYAEARKPSILGIALTAILVLGTGFVIYRKKRKANS